MPSMLVLGGARSGKSAYAQNWAEKQAKNAGKQPIMIATAQAFDTEMEDRIARHRVERGGEWLTIEAPLKLAEAIDGLESGAVAVVDCLTLWLSNLMMNETPIADATAILVEAIRRTPADIALVSNEVGMGIVPDNALARRFRDEAGRINQRVAAAADRAVFVIAGLPTALKP